MKLLGPLRSRSSRRSTPKTGSALAAHMTDDVRLHLGDVETLEDKTVNRRDQAMTTRPTVSGSRAFRLVKTMNSIPNDKPSDSRPARGPSHHPAELGVRADR